MTEIPQVTPPTSHSAYGYVTACLIRRSTDDSDPDDLPTIRAAMNVTGEFVPKRGQHRTSDYPALLIEERIPFTVGPSGYIRDGMENSPIALGVGDWTATFAGPPGVTVQPIEFSLTEAHTKASPLNLYDLVPPTPPGGQQPAYMLVPPTIPVGHLLSVGADGLAGVDPASLGGGGSGEVEQVTLTGNLAYELPAGASPNRVHSVVFTQDATGGRTVTYGGAPVAVDLTAGASTLVEVWPGGKVVLPGAGGVDAEGVQDVVGSMIVGAGGTYDDAGGTISLPAVAGVADPTTAALPLYVPTYDANPSVTHPDVLHIPGGWNGYEYWMAFTPYPAAGRENPSIVASHDGIAWEVPPGLVNPIATNAQALAGGYDFWNDPDLVLSPDGTTLVLYFGGMKSGVKNDLLRTSSTDGVTWTTPAVVIGTTLGTEWDKSAAVIVEGDGTYTMFSAGDPDIRRRTSADGITWSAFTNVTRPALPAGYGFWHIDVTKVGGVYHAVATGSTANASVTPYRIFHWTSTDGLAWSGSPVPAVPLTGSKYDAFGHYRCSIQPAASGRAGRFDVWTACIGSGLSALPGSLSAAVATSHGNANHRIGVLRDYDFLATQWGAWPTPAALNDPTGALPGLDEVWAMAGDLVIASGAPVASTLQGWPSWILPEVPAGTHELAVAFPPVPHTWNAYAVEALIANPGITTGGDFRMRGYCQRLTPGEALSLTAGTTIDVVRAAPAVKDVPQWLSIWDPDPTWNRAGQPLRIRFGRGTGGADTFANDLHVLAVRLRRVA